LIPIAKPLVGAEEAEAAHKTVLSGWLSQGEQVACFEREFAEIVGANHACAVSNCTTALHLALEAVGVGTGDDVVTVSHSFVATANTISQCGARPVFVDIEAGGFNIDPSAVEGAITPRTRAILCVHQMGMPCDLSAILEIASRHGLPVVEDAACAIGSEVRIDGLWRKIGRPEGDVACFSFHPRKVITTGEGGMLTTNRPDLDATFRLRRQHGMSVSDRVRHRSDSIIFEEYPVRGYNYRMTDMQAAVGREQLRRLPAIIARRRALANRYRMMLSDFPAVRVPQEPDWARSNWQSYCVELNTDIDQRVLMQHMLDRGIATRRGIMCAHLEGAHADREHPNPLTRSEEVRDHSILIPLFGQMTDEEQQFVARTLREGARAARRVAPMLKAVEA
jgi:dTDP-4-amino-4,6-dideoxygalactose transaminase